MKTSSLLLCSVSASLLLVGCGPSGGSNEPKPISVHMEFDVPAGVEKTQCLTVRADNAEKFDFSQITSSMAGGSHHLILYRDASTLVGATPPPEGLGNCDMDAARLYVYGAQTPERTMDLPAGIAVQLPADSLLILEVHVANASDQTVHADATVTMHPAVPGSVENYAGEIFYMDTAFQIPAGAGMSGAPAYAHETTCEVPPGVNVYRLGSHTHKRLAKFEISHRDVAGGADLSLLYENTDWHAPKEIFYPDASPLPIGQGQGLRFSCSWTNETAGTIQYGPSVEDEMCIVSAGYWPAVNGPMNLGGNLFCVDGTLYY